MVFIAQDYKLPTYLFIDQHPSDKVIPGLIVKIVSEELSNLKKTRKTLVTSISNDEYNSLSLFGN